MIIQTVRGEASSYFDLIVKAREWNSNHSGVYVEKKPGVETNPYLRKLGVEPDVKCEDGRVMTLRNPSLMTKEISKLTLNEHGTTFHITSLQLVDPDNAPDRFEREALKKFEQGAEEAWEIDRSGGQAVFRLIKPLKIKPGCLSCHKKYALGDIRGGISINIPFGDIDNQLRTSRARILSLSILTLGIFMGTLYFMSSRLIKKLYAAQEQLREMSVTDELTGIHNRRFIMERLGEEFQKARRTNTPLAAIMLDLDHFKNINDTYGHPFGDVVLKTVAERVKGRLRAYDLFGRAGGEEFLILTPLTPLGDATVLAERIRDIIRSEKIGDGISEVTMTASLGVSVLTERDEDPDALLGRADRALYKAKEQGRDRVAVND